MKKTKSNKKSWTQDMPVWIAIVSALILGYLVYAVGVKSRDSRSSANDGVDVGVVLPVASDRE
ncbi:MAG: hypothetical protein WC069_03075 [Candidatus Shapirobacteria bacterium]